MYNQKTEQQKEENERIINDSICQDQLKVLPNNAFVEIIEQPAPKAIRFRYECEERVASVPGINSTPRNKTYPSIKVVGYNGRAIVVVSCVTKDPPFRPHPFRLVGKDGCKKGVFTAELNRDTMSMTFNNLGIQCIKLKDISDSLLLREEIKVDPYKTGFAHRKNSSINIDLNAVRLCFQVFIENYDRTRFSIPLPPIVSDPIYDKKGKNFLTICKLSHCSASCGGGKEIIILCERIVKDDIKVRFFEKINNVEIWEAYCDTINVHKQVAVSFKVPRYKSVDITESIKGFIQLKRPSDNAFSEPLPFDFLPLNVDLDVIGKKRKRLRDSESYINHCNKLQPEKNLSQSTILQNNNTFVEANEKKNLASKHPTNYIDFYGGMSQFYEFNKYQLHQYNPSSQYISQTGATPYFYNQDSTIVNNNNNNIGLQQTTIQNCNEISSDCTINKHLFSNPFHNTHFHNTLNNNLLSSNNPFHNNYQYSMIPNKLSNNNLSNMNDIRNNILTDLERYQVNSSIQTSLYQQMPIMDCFKQKQF